MKSLITYLTVLLFSIANVRAVGPACYQITGMTIPGTGLAQVESHTWTDPVLGERQQIVGVYVPAPGDTNMYDVFITLSQSHTGSVEYTTAAQWFLNCGRLCCPNRITYDGPRCGDYTELSNSIHVWVFLHGDTNGAPVAYNWIRMKMP